MPSRFEWHTRLLIRLDGVPLEMITAMSRKNILILILIISTVFVYWNAVGNDFIMFDDDTYIYENPFLRNNGIMSAVHWALTTFHAANWHPVTWFSHMLDIQLFGLAPAGHHAMSVLFHVTNTVLLFVLLHRVTGAVWRSGIVAALFALHPLHVESVVWVAERKDVLCAFFYLLSLYVYAGYVKNPKIARYVPVVITVALALASKPMAVTLPAAMLLLDLWPLQRTGYRIDFTSGITATGARTRSVRYLCIEKIPFMMLAAISSSLTYIAQRHGNAITTLANTSVMTRLENAALTYVKYLGKTIWPHNLTIFYPFPKDIPAMQAIAACIALAVVTTVAIKQFRQRPYILFGWLWYCGTMLPVIGIVRVGLQGMADRYTYIPLIGIFVSLVWWGADISKNRPHRNYLLGVPTAILLTISALLTWQQISYWQNTTTLFTHALAATDDNYLAHTVLARQLEKEGRLEEALAHLDTAVNIAPWYEYAKIRQGIILKSQGRLDAATMKYTEAILQNNNSVSGHINLGIVLGLQDKLEEALRNFDTAVRLDPHSALGHYNMGLTLSRLERIDEAIIHYETANRIDPFNPECHNNYGIALINKGRVHEAIREFMIAVKLKPDFFDAVSNRELAIKLQQQVQ